MRFSWPVFALTIVTMASHVTATSLVYLRHGGQLSTEAPDFKVISKDEMSHAMDLHAKTPYFHSDFAHTDYVADQAYGASWLTPPLEAPATLAQGPIKVVLWIGTNAASTLVTASLSRRSALGGWGSLSGATADTLHREPGKELPLPGQPMMATSSMSPPGFAVALPIAMELDQAVELAAGDVLRLDVSCPNSTSDGEKRIDHRIWHNPKWPSTLELALEAASFKFAPHPPIRQSVGSTVVA